MGTLKTIKALISRMSLVRFIKFGYLYNWYVASDVRNIANTGWKVPTKAEMDVFITYIGGGTGTAPKIKEQGSEYWQANTATNEMLFNARGAGKRTQAGDFDLLFQAFHLFTIDDFNDYQHTGLRVVFSSDDISGWNAGGIALWTKANGASLRLIKENTLLTHGQISTYRGNDGRVYNTICIGTQEWLSENLVETKYRNGNLIPIVTDATEWGALTTGARCSYNNDITNVFI